MNAHSTPSKPPAASPAGGAVGFGIDIGGSGVKGAPVDLVSGELTAERLRIETPVPSTPQAVAEVVTQILDHFDWQGPFGCTIPGVVQNGVVRTAANIDKSWLDTDGDTLFEKVTGRPCHLLNDADAAAVAETALGAAAGHPGLVIVATMGTGIGVGLIHNGVLVPNAELGHVELDGRDAESHAAASARTREDLSWKQWAPRVEHYLRHLENLLWPDLFVIGGGVSRKHEKWLPLVNIRTPIEVARLRNTAGIVGAALEVTRRGA